MEKILPVIEHNGEQVILYSREDAIMEPLFPKELRIKLSNFPNCGFVIMKKLSDNSWSMFIEN